MRKYIYLSLLILAGCDNHKATTTEPVTNPLPPTPVAQKVRPASTTPLAKPAPSAGSNVTISDTYFENSNFGVSFSHGEEVIVKNLTLARENAFSIFYQNIKSGNFVIKELPTSIKMEYFLNVGKAAYKKKYKASNFESKEYTAPTGLKFYTLRCHVDYKGIPRTLERFIHISPLNATTNRVFMFEFYLTNHTYRRQHPAFLKLINTFMVAKPAAK